MKKLICFVLVPLVLLSCLTACNFTKNISGALTEEAESAPKVEEMMTALAENRASDAKSLMHPQVTENADAAIAQMCDYLAGREISSMEQRNINVHTSTGTSGRTRQEQMTYQVTLNDGTVFYLNAVYFSDAAGSGFVAFQLVLGLV
ncbi:MAG: hypothetical protein ACI3VZ_04095 [Faecousia sp.]